MEKEHIVFGDEYRRIVEKEHIVFGDECRRKCGGKRSPVLSVDQYMYGTDSRGSVHPGVSGNLNEGRNKSWIRQ